MPSIPTVDFSNWDSLASNKEKQEVAHKLIEACRTVGFVYITGHSIAPERLTKAFNWSQSLFDMDREQKMLAPHPDGHKVHRGYSWPGLEKVSNAMGDETDPDLSKTLRFIADVKESYEIGSQWNKDQPNIWLPDNVLPGFREFMQDFYWECHASAQKILSAMALGLGLPDEDHFHPTHPGHNNQLRLLHYPPVPAAAIESGSAARMQAHSDWGSIILLFQDDCGGLQAGFDQFPRLICSRLRIRTSLATSSMLLL